MSKPVTEIKCPHCGNTNLSKMEHHEDVVSTRTLERLEDGTLYYSADSREEVEYAENPRLFCKVPTCFKDFPIPEGLGLDVDFR